jgi:hypothetical protein
MAAVVGRVGGVLSGIGLAQNQGLGIMGTVACAAGGFLLGKILDSALEGNLLNAALEEAESKTPKEMPE